MSGNKYGAETCYVNRKNGEYCDKSSPYSVHFGSLLEARTYRTLWRRDLIVNCQHKIQVAPATRRFAPLIWKCDFRVFSKKLELPHLNIEAKGISFPDFVLKLQLLDRNFPREVDNLIIVIDGVNTQIPRALKSLVDNKQIVTRAELSTYLQSKGY